MNISRIQRQNKRSKWGRRSVRGIASLVLASVLLGSAAFVSLPQTAVAQEGQAPAEGRQFSAKTGEIVNEALQLLQSENYSAAISPLQRALALPELNAYEKSTIHQMLGSAYYEMNQYNQAIQAFENAISAGGLLPNERTQLRLNIAQLLIANGQPARGAQMLEDYARAGGQLKPKHIEYLWQAWSQAEQYNRALPWAEKWFRNANPKERKHFDLLNFLYNNLNMPGKQADIVKQMINRWPEDKSLWDAWASMLANGGREQESFEVTKMLYLGGALTSQQDLEKVVQYYSYYDMPYQAAEILKKEMNAGRIPQSTEKLIQLSDLYRQSREYKKAIPYLEKAASSSGKAKLYADLGEALYNEGDCNRAETAFRKAISLGYDKGKSLMLIANCRYDQAAKEERPKCLEDGSFTPNTPWEKKREIAMAAFDQVPASSGEGRNARKWKKFITDEKKALKNRCVFEKDLKRQKCYGMIARAKKAEFLEGKFVLPDPNCKAFVPAWEAEFQKVTKGDKKK